MSFEETEAQAAMESEGSPGAAEARTFDALHAEIVADCERDLTAEAGTHATGAAPFGFSPLVLLPTVVRTLLDTVIDFAGEPIEALATANRDLIKTVITPKALELIERIVRDIEGQASGA